jgi:hypothetical protein
VTWPFCGPFVFEATIVAESRNSIFTMRPVSFPAAASMCLLGWHRYDLADETYAGSMEERLDEPRHLSCGCLACLKDGFQSSDDINLCIQGSNV